MNRVSANSPVTKTDQTDVAVAGHDPHCNLFFNPTLK